MMDQEKIARLPKWAQGQIRNDQNTIASLKAHIAELNESNPDSNVQVSDYVHGDYGLPTDSEVDFYLGDPPYRKFRNMITVQHLRTKDRKVLRVSCSETLVITPAATNTIEISTQR